MNIKKLIPDLTVRTAFYLDIYRVIPRLITLAYFGMVLYMGMWFMGLAEPTAAQAAFVSTIVAMFSGVAGFYFNSGFNWKEYLKEFKDDQTKTD